MSATPATLRRRASVVRALRAWFHEHGFVEIEAPTLVRSPALEEHLEAFPIGEAWLHTSPEFALKRVLADGLCRVFSITPCYRAEEWGPMHGTEFTMLEWYRVGVGYRGVMEDCAALLSAACAAAGEPLPAIESLSFHEAMERHSPGPLPEDPTELMRRWVNDVEPRLQAPTLVRDYPADQSAFAELRGEVAERFELYWRGVELGNAFTELRDPEELLERWEHSGRERRAAGRLPHPIDPRVVDATARYPRCGGMAMGLDRLVMLLLGLADIREARVSG